MQRLGLGAYDGTTNSSQNPAPENDDAIGQALESMIR